MNRPDRRNALNPDMTRGLVEAARRAAEDHEVRAVLLKGAGGTFCVGGDVKSMAEGRAPLPFEAKMANLRRGMEVSRILHEMPKPVVAQLDGAAAGAGLSIALACDLRVASASCKITTAFAKVGLSGDYGGTYFLTQMLGSAKARELYLTVAGADGAGSATARHGDESRSGRRGRSRGARTCDVAGAGAVDHARLYQAQHQQCRALSLEACFDAEAIHHSRSGETADHKEAAKAFVEKRKPVFPGPLRWPSYLQAAADLPGGAAARARDLAISPRSWGLMSATATATSPNTGSRTRCCRSTPSCWKWWRRSSRAPRRGAFSTRPAAAAAIWRSSAATIPTRAASTPMAIGVRTANVITHAPYHGVQLHPRDCRAAFIEFNHTAGSDDILGPYPPAGPGLAEIDPQGCDAGADGRGDAEPGSAGAGGALGEDLRALPSARMPAARRN